MGMRGRIVAGEGEWVAGRLSWHDRPVPFYERAESNVDRSSTVNYALRVEQLLMKSANQAGTFILSLIATLFSVQVGHAQKRDCPDVGQHAFDEAVTLRSWDALYKSYKLHRQCDDGAIGEGYSESVARILSDQWNTLPGLARLASKDSQFRAFVIGHVDATLNMDDVRKIRKNAKTQCPTGLRTVCNDLAKQADAALQEDASTP